MKQIDKFLMLSLLYVLLGGMVANAQATLRGKVQDADTGEDLIGAAISLLTEGGGTITNYEGEFLLKVQNLPANLRVSYTGYTTQEIQVTEAESRILVRLQPNSIIIEETVVRGQRIDERQKAAPLTVENLDAIAIKETPAVSFYNSLGNLKGVDLTTASLGFTIVNTRGFNSTSPVRSLQIIDGVDNQAPGLNFSLGNFLGCSELDVQSVELVAGASGPFYGPNAFNGVISMKTKDPFIQKGLSVSLKGGERDLFEGAIRWADAFKNKAGSDVVAYKLNFCYLRAYDWVADNYDPVYESTSDARNPGGYDAVNIYGDEYRAGFDYSRESPWSDRVALGVLHRTGYREVDLVDYNTRNTKASASVYFRLKPALEFESPELILSSSFGSGTTVYQGDNRFSLRNIRFFQNRIELRKKDKYFLRAYATNEDAGKSYDPYYTALRLQSASKSNGQWLGDYSQYWINIGNYDAKMRQTGYPSLQVIYDPVTMMFVASFDTVEAQRWFDNNYNTLLDWHQNARTYADTLSGTFFKGHFFPGTPEFEDAFDRITSAKSGDAGGTRFFDKSALYHVHGEYRFTPKWLSHWVAGGNFRFYRPYSEGTIFSDTLARQYDGGVAVDSSYKRITNWEFGLYTGIEKKILNDRIILSGTVRMDKNQNFDYLFTPALSAVYAPDQKNYLRLSFSSAIRNPTLTDQYLFLNVGPATLVGNLNGFNNLVSVDSFIAGVNSGNFNLFDDVDVAPIRPEKVRTFEVGYRTTIWNRIYLDAGYYFNFYNDFIGYNIGLVAPVSVGVLDVSRIRAYRVAANSTNQVTTQGFALGMNFYFGNYYQLSGNYSWNKLNKLDVEDPIIPAFNTPEHKFNIGISGRDVPFLGLKRTGFSLNYKWIQGFLFEGSPQFTGFIPTYDMVDAQWNVTFDRVHTTFKIGVSNLFGIKPLFEDSPTGESRLKAAFNNRNFQTYGGPRIGRMAYISAVYNFERR
ncbi:MAG: carboxypeptidase-like regulatory domain-containing protein [Saprospirales bacterium]|nr:carboxypeptidase-like regulatory domain-containing protein [Saprospirales bacterium]